MLPAIGAIAIAGYVYSASGSESTVKGEERISDPAASEQRESIHSGFLRPANRGHNIIDSEEVRIIRPRGGHRNPMLNAAEWQQYHYEKNNKLGEMYSWARALDNLKILRYNYQKKPGLLQLPNREGYPEFNRLPNAHFDRESAATPLDERIDLYRDPFGTSGGAPLHGHSNVVLNKLYVGNAWGPGGQEFVAVGNQHRDPGYADVRPTGILRRESSSGQSDSSGKRVRFE